MYDIKFWQELGWLVLGALIVALATELAGFQPEAITDWRIWAVGLAGVLTRAIGIAVMAAFGKAQMTKPQDPDKPE